MGIWQTDRTASEYVSHDLLMLSDRKMARANRRCRCRCCGAKEEMRGECGSERESGELTGVGEIDK